MKTRKSAWFSPSSKTKVVAEACHSVIEVTLRAIPFFPFLTTAAYSAMSYFAFTSDYPSHFPVDGFEWHSRFEFFRVFDGGKKSHSLNYRGVEYEVRWDANELKLSVHSNQSEKASLSLASLEGRAKAYLNQKGGTQVPQALLTERAESPHARALFLVEALSLERSESGFRVLHLKGDLLFSSRSKARSSGQK